MSQDFTTPVGRLEHRGAGRTRTELSVLRGAATLLFVGVILSLLAGLLHPDREPPNNHSAAFTAYATSDLWIVVHLGQFAGIALIIAGLLVLFFALNVHTGLLGWAGRCGASFALVALGLYGVLQAVDGIALKHAVDAWMTALDEEKAARFASAEAVRWLEWGVRSYYSFMLGLSFILFATVMVRTARLLRPIGYLMGMSGLAYIMQGWVIGVEGFSATNTIPTLLGILFTLVWSTWLLISAWRTQASGESLPVA